MVTTWYQSPLSHPPCPHPPLATGSGHTLQSATRSWKFNLGDVRKAAVSLRQKGPWRCCLFCLDAFMQGCAIGESHGVSIMLVHLFLWHTDSGWSFAQQWMSPVINFRAVFLPVFFFLVLFNDGRETIILIQPHFSNSMYFGLFSPHFFHLWILSLNWQRFYFYFYFVNFSKRKMKINVLLWILQYFFLNPAKSSLALNIFHCKEYKIHQLSSTSFLNFS